MSQQQSVFRGRLFNRCKFSSGNQFRHHRTNATIADRWDNRDAGKDGSDGVQKSDVCCTDFSASTTGLRNLGFLRCSSAAPAVAIPRLGAGKGNVVNRHYSRGSFLSNVIVYGPSP
jgi:hypothetical protein